MAKSTLVLTACDGCGRISMDGADIATVTISAPGKLSTVRRLEACPTCLAEMEAWFAKHDKDAEPTSVTL